MYKLGYLGALRGHSRSSAMSPFDRAHTTSYSTLIETFYRFRDIAGYLSKVADFDSPHLHLATVGGDPGRISQRSSASEMQIPCSIVHCCLRDLKFSHFSRTPTCDRRADGRTDGQTDGHGPMASTAYAYHRAVKINGKRLQVAEISHFYRAMLYA